MIGSCPSVDRQACRWEWRQFSEVPDWQGYNNALYEDINSKDASRMAETSKPAKSNPGLLIFIYRHLGDIFEDGALKVTAVVIAFLWFCGNYDDFMTIVETLMNVFGPVAKGFRCLIGLVIGGPSC
jgi:hypothetical protein